MKRYKGILVLVLCMSIFALSGCGKGDDDSENTENEAVDVSDINVEVAYPTVRTISQSGSYIGTVETGEKVSVTPHIGGYVKTRYFGLGDVVNKGDVLFTIDDSSLQLEKKKAEADVKDANAALAKDRAENEATKFEVNETLYTLDTKSQENYNSIQKAIRTEYEARLDLYKACADESIHKDEEKYLEELIKSDKAGKESAKEFANELNVFKSIYTSIKSAPDHDAAAAIAVNNGVDAADIPDDKNPAQIADIYLNKKTMYKSEAELDKAISSSEEAAGGETQAQHESSKRTNELAIIADEVSAEKEKGNIASAQEDIALKRKIAADYEIFTKAKIWAASQAKLAVGNSSVLSSSVKLSKAQIDLEIAELKLKNTSVTSPVSGEIVECKIEDSGVVSEQSPAYTIIDTSKKKAVFYVTGDAKNNMTVGQTATIEKSGTQYEATINHISDTPDEKKLLYKVTAILSEDDKASIDAGTSIRLITSIKKSNDALTVPISAVYYDEGNAFVYVAENGVANRTMIETGIDDDKDIEVLSGLSPEDKVIVSWSEQLEDNAPVNVTKTADTVSVTAAGTDEKEAEADSAPAMAVENEADGSENSDTEALYVETTTNVNIRMDPTTDSEKLETAATGTRFIKVGDVAGGWTRIIYNDSEAFIKSDYVRECRE
jgi:RND family efflux transporter MFP subunit